MSNQWRKEYEGEAVVMSSGLVYTNMTQPKGLTLGEVKAMIEARPRSMYYQKTLTRRLTLADALARDRFEDIGTPMDFSVSLSLFNVEHDREFKKLPQSGEQLLNNKYRSKPKRI